MFKALWWLEGKNWDISNGIQETTWQGYYIVAPKTAFLEFGFCSASKITQSLEVCNLKQYKIYYHTVLEVRNSEMGLTDLKIKESAGLCVPSRGSAEESISLSVPASRGCLHSLAHGLLSSSKPAMAGQIFVTLHHSDSPASLFYL